MTTTFPVLRAAEIPVEQNDQPWLIDTLWCHQAVGILGGPAKACKSWLGLDMAISVASNTPCLTRFPVQESGSALLYMAEDSLPAVRQRIQAICHHRSLSLAALDLFVIDSPILRLDLSEHRQKLERTLRKIQPRLLFLDPLVRLHRADENSALEMGAILGFLRELQRTFKLALVLVHHTSKKHHTHPGQALRGSSDIYAWTDSSLFIQKNRNTLILTVEHRSAPAPPPMMLKLVQGARDTATHLEVVSDWTSPQAQRDTPLTDDIRNLLELAHRPLTREVIRHELKVKNQTLGAALTTLAQKDLIHHSAQGWFLMQNNTSDAAEEGSEHDQC